MAQTFTSDEPIPAFLALPDEPLSPEEVEQLADLTPEARRERFVITDDNGAEWAMRKLARARHDALAATMQAQEWTRRVDDWLRQVTAGPNRDAGFFAGLLSDYGLRQRAEGRKSVPLPSGTITTRGTTEPKVTITDETAVVAWVDGHLMTEVREVLAKTLQVHAIELPPEGLDALGTHLGELIETHSAVLTRKPLVSKLRERVNVVTTEDKGMRVIDPSTAEPVPGLVAEVPEPTATVTPGR